jgi:hypothetical protein
VEGPGYAEELLERVLRGELAGRPDLIFDFNPAKLLVDGAPEGSALVSSSAVVNHVSDVLQFLVGPAVV